MISFVFLEIALYMVLAMASKAVTTIVLPKYFNNIPDWIKWVDMLVFLVLMIIGTFFITINFPSPYIG